MTTRSSKPIITRTVYRSFDLQIISRISESYFQMGLGFSDPLVSQKVSQSSNAKSIDSFADILRFFDSQTRLKTRAEERPGIQRSSQ